MAPPRRRVAKERVRIPEDVEDDLVDWYREHSIFYDKAHRDYKDTAQKGNLMQDKAVSLNLGMTSLELKTWFAGMRTQFTKLTKEPPSGSGKKKKLTAREQWIVERFHFFEPHIERTASKSSLQPAPSDDARSSSPASGASSTASRPSRQPAKRTRLQDQPPAMDPAPAPAPAAGPDMRSPWDACRDLVNAMDNMTKSYDKRLRAEQSDENPLSHRTLPETYMMAHRRGFFANMYERCAMFSRELWSEMREGIEKVVSECEKKYNFEISQSEMRGAGPYTNWSYMQQQQYLQSRYQQSPRSQPFTMSSNYMAPSTQQPFQPPQPVQHQFQAPPPAHRSFLADLASATDEVL